MTFSRQFTALSVAAVLLCSARVSAATVTFDGHTSLSRQVDIEHFGQFKNDEWAGEMEVTVDGQPFIAYCIDLNNDAPNTPWSATLVSLALSTINGKNAIGYLYDNYASTVATANDAAGLQVAIWELLDDSPGARNLDLHIFKYLGAPSQAANIKARAQFYLDQLPANVNTYVPTSNILLDLTNPFSQTLIIPEPSSLSVLAVGALWRFAAAGNRRS